MNLPEPVRTYLHQLLIEKRDPAYLVASPDGMLIELGGNLSLYGLQNLRKGAALDNQVDWLVGLFPLTAQDVSLPCIKTTEDTFADVYLFRDGNTYVVLLVDVTSAEATQGLLQQKANELHLLRKQHAHFCHLLHQFDIALLEQKERDVFLLIGKAPDWIKHCGLRLKETPGEYTLNDELEFLGNFVAEAEEFWIYGEGHYKSGPWVETAPDGQEWYFEATAMKSGATGILLIERIAPYDDPRFALIQKAREHQLEYIQLARKEETLREKELRSRILLQAVPDWIFLINPEGRILDLKATMGKNPFMFAEFIGKELSEIFPEDAAEKMVQCANRARDRKELQACKFFLGPEEAPVQFEARAVSVGSSSVVLLVRDLNE